MNLAQINVNCKYIDKIITIATTIFQPTFNTFLFSSGEGIVEFLDIDIVLMLRGKKPVY